MRATPEMAASRIVLARGEATAGAQPYVRPFGVGVRIHRQESTIGAGWSPRRTSGFRRSARRAPRSDCWASSRAARPTRAPANPCLPLAGRSRSGPPRARSRSESPARRPDRRRSSARAPARQHRAVRARSCLSNHVPRSAKRGTGKSLAVRVLAACFGVRGSRRIVEVHKEDLLKVPRGAQALRGAPFRFLLLRRSLRRSCSCATELKAALEDAPASCRRRTCASSRPATAPPAAGDERRQPRRASR